MTIKFLGDIEEAQVPVLQEVVGTAVASCTAFSLDIQGVGVFPDLRRPRILWAGVSGAVDHLQALVSLIDKALEPLGFSTETKPFRPHLTLARIKPHVRDVGAALAKAGICQESSVFGTLNFNQLCLLKSELTPQGAKYSRLWEVPFPRETS